MDVTHLTSTKTAAYVSSRGHRLSVASVAGTWLPEASVDGVKLDFDRWPISESPFVSCADRVLDVNDGRNGFRIDWRDETPFYTYYEIRNAQRADTSRRFLRNGKLVTETF